MTLGDVKLQLIRAVLPAGVQGNGYTSTEDRVYWGLADASGNIIQSPDWQFIDIDEKRILLVKRQLVRRLVYDASAKSHLRTIQAKGKFESYEFILNPQDRRKIDRFLIAESYRFLAGDGDNYRADRITIFGGTGEVERVYEPVAKYRRAENGYWIGIGSVYALNGWEKGTCEMVTLDEELNETGHFRNARDVVVCSSLTGSTWDSRKVRLVESPEHPWLYWVPGKHWTSFAPPEGTVGVLPYRQSEVRVYENEIKVGEESYAKRTFWPPRLCYWLVGIQPDSGPLRYAIANHDFSEIGDTHYIDWAFLPSDEQPRILGFKRDAIKPGVTYPYWWLALKRESDGMWEMKSPYAMCEVVGNTDLTASHQMAEEHWKKINDREHKLEAVRLAEEKKRLQELRKQKVEEYEAALASGDIRTVIRLAHSVGESLKPQILAGSLTESELRELAKEPGWPTDQKLAQEALKQYEKPAPAAPVAVKVTCNRCGGKGYLVSTRDVEIRYSPTHTYRNGLVITERTTSTHQQQHYDGLCNVCNGSGVVEQ